jgi:hypothetical protein
VARAARVDAVDQVAARGAVVRVVVAVDRGAAQDAAVRVAAVADRAAVRDAAVAVMRGVAIARAVISSRT